MTDGTWLQWGRNFSVAEGAPNKVWAGAPALLQWGRNFSVAEGGWSKDGMHWT